MVFREERDRAAKALEGFASGSTPSSQFEEEYDGGSPHRDQGVRAVANAIWLLYSDDEDASLAPERLSDERVASLLGRCLAFLRSDLEYEWPREDLDRLERVGGMANALTLGWLGRRITISNASFDREMRQFGNMDFWPFARELDLQRASNAAEPSP